MNIPLRLLDWQKVKKTGRGYTRRELTVIPLLKELAAEKPITSFLHVGFHDYQDIRNRWWIDICRANKIDWHILEIFEPNVENFLKHPPAADRHRITLDNLKDMGMLFNRKFDVFLHWHGPEEQGQAYGNPYEEHISFWSCDDFHQLGFATVTVADKKPGHITAYRFLQRAK
jgi:hypothetical protein